MAATFTKPRKNVTFLKPEQAILIYCDFDCASGFGNLAKELITRWADNLKFTHINICAINNIQSTVYNYQGRKNVTVIPAGQLEAIAIPDVKSRDMMCRTGFLQFLRDFEWAAVVIIQDIEIIASMQADLKKIIDYHTEHKKLTPRTIVYFPIDSVPNQKDLDVLDQIDEIITYTQYGKEVVCNFKPELAEKVDVVPHGVDTKMFFPLPAARKKKIKEKMFGKGKFVVGTVNRNSARKDPATTILAFDKFRTENKVDNAVLYMHMTPIDFAGVNLLKLCEKLGLMVQKDVYFPEDVDWNVGIPESDLNEIYNTFDVFVTTSTAEGWGLTVTEAMACKIPVICPTHTSLDEIGRRFQKIKDNQLKAIPAFYDTIHPVQKLDEVVFTNDCEKVRFKSNTQEVANQITKIWFESLLGNNGPVGNSGPGLDKETIIENAHNFVSTLTWDTSADAIWQHIIKHLPKPL